jgi:hypothetical protein
VDIMDNGAPLLLVLSTAIVRGRVRGQTPKTGEDSPILLGRTPKPGYVLLMCCSCVANVLLMCC